MKLINAKNANVLTIWWFIVLAIIAAGIIISTLMFYGKEIDVRELEAQSLNQRIMSCLVEQGKISQDFLNDKNFDIFKNCGLNGDILQNKNFGKYFIKISVTGIESRVYGANLEKDCEIKKTLTAKNFPLCFTSNRVSGDRIISVMTGSNYLWGNLYAKV